MKKSLTLNIALALILGLASVVGCQSTPVSTPLTAKQVADDGAAQIEFWHNLASRPVASNDEAFHALLLFLDGKDSTPDYAHRVQLLQMRGILPMSFNQPGDVAIRRGTLAVAMVKGLSIGGGVMLRFIGATPRYSLRELHYMALFPESSENQTFSGEDFVGIIGRMEDYEKLAAAGNPAGQAAQIRRDSVAHQDSLRRDMLARQEVERWSIIKALAPPQSTLTFGPPVIGFQPTTVAAADTPKPDAVPAPAEAPPPAALGEALKATVTGVKGLVQYRAKEGDAWQAVKVGLVVDQGVEFRTALRSAVTFTTPPGNTVKLDRLGTIKLVDAIKQGGKATTNLGMKYGVSEVKVEAGGPEHETVIATPGSTLAIRGTIAWIQSCGRSFPDQVRVSDGTGAYASYNGKKYDMSDKDDDATTNTNVGSPADLAFINSAFNPNANGQTGVDQHLTNLSPQGIEQFRQTGVGGVRNFTNADAIRTLAGGEPPVVLVGRLNFIVSWQGNADLDSFVITPLNEGLTVFPSGGIPGFSGNIGPARTTPSGGAVNLDDTSANGAEQLFWNSGFPNGTYTYGTRYFGGSGPAVATLDVFLDGNRVGQRVTGTLNQSGDFISRTINITGGVSNTPALTARVVRRAN